MAVKIAIPLLFLFQICFTTKTQAQFAPAAGQPGSTAIYKDSSIFIDWASACSVVRGYQNVDNVSAGYVSAGDSTMALGPAGSNSIVSLGDGGTATCTFNYPVVNGPGYDFAVFENSFDDNFLELAFVEVSSNGTDFYRFASTSLTQDTLQVGPFDTIMDPTLLNNLAGKYRMFYGTPFDLSELDTVPGLDINNITHIRVRDVIGCIDQVYATTDANGNKINEHWPTEFITGGFDLDAIGVIYNTVYNGLAELNQLQDVTVYPNPANDRLFINAIADKIEIYSVVGHLYYSSSNAASTLDISCFETGVYYLRIEKNKQIATVKFIKD
jgi:hypothetical protein